MVESFKMRWAIIAATVAFGALWISPNFVKYSPGSFLSRYKIVEGLDIQGGLHVVMGVDVQSVVQEEIARESKDLQERFKENGVTVQSVEVTGANNTEITVVPGSASAKDGVVKFIADRYGSTLQVVQATDEKIILRFFDAVMLQKKQNTVSQAIEVIRNRIDEFGVAEPSIVAQGDDRILVQLPGIQDAAGAKELINRTARLDFRVVSNEVPADKLNSMIDAAEKAGKYKLGAGQEGGLKYQEYVKRLNADLAQQLPKNTKLVFEKLENATSLEVGRQPFLVHTDLGLNGKELNDAAVRPDEYGKPEVVFSFTVTGKNQFADLTAKAAGGYLAIVLDDVVKSAPSVREQINSDSARITLGGGRDYEASLKEATFIATSLRAGALPAALTQLEERTVGPSLGGDSVAKAKKGAIAGTIIVLLFLIGYYRVAGIAADIALILNFFFTFAILTSLGATLTLPGIAGLALTVGMSVDANVVIFERIKEELRKGATQAAALRDGFANSYSAVFDSNITAILTCIVLVYYGTGPIRGFAISLMTGIICSMFTAVFVSRTILDTLVIKYKVNILSPKKG